MKTKHLLDFLRSVSNRRCVLYGAGPAARELVAEIRFPIDYVVDDNADLWGDRLAGAEIRSPDTLRDEPETDRPLVVIASTLVGQISRRLAALGYERGNDAVLSPLVMERDHEAAQERHPTLLVTSPSDDGGVFRVDLNDRSVERLMPGNCRGLAPVEDGYWLALEFSGLVKLDRRYNEVARIPYEENLNVHSLAVDPDRGRLYVAETRMDRIGVYDTSSLERVGQIAVGRTAEPNQAQHHVNDLKLVRGELLVAMFSADGVHRDGISKDGAVLRFDPESGVPLGRMLGGLEQPHSILYGDDGLWICNSMARTLQHGDRTAVHLLGYTRGLARHGEYFYIGQSQMRRLSRFRDRFDNISLDCAVNIWDSDLKTVRTITMPFDNIYDIVPIDDDR